MADAPSISDQDTTEDKKFDRPQQLDPAAVLVPFANGTITRAARLFTAPGNPASVRHTNPTASLRVGGVNNPAG
jgi:hypothetical protein